MSFQFDGTNKPASMGEFIKRGNGIYDELQKAEDFEASRSGQYIAIDVDSKKHFFGETREEAMHAGEAELPNVVFFVRRIGSLDVIASQHPYLSRSRLGDARIL